jgi:hypothetical protein
VVAHSLAQKVQAIKVRIQVAVLWVIRVAKAVEVQKVVLSVVPKV